MNTNKEDPSPEQREKKFWASPKTTPPTWLDSDATTVPSGINESKNNLDTQCNYNRM